MGTGNCKLLNVIDLMMRIGFLVTVWIFYVICGFVSVISIFFVCQ